MKKGAKHSGSFSKENLQSIEDFPLLTPSERLLLLLFPDKMIKAKWFLLGLVNPFTLKIANKLLKELRSYKSWTSGSFGSSGMQLKTNRELEFSKILLISNFWPTVKNWLRMQTFLCANFGICYHLIQLHKITSFVLLWLWISNHKHN